MSAPGTVDKANVETKLHSHEAYVTIPDLFVSFVAQKPQLNPHYERIKAESEAWMVKMCGYDEEDLKRYKRVDFSYFAALMAPEAGPEEFRTICDFCNWGSRSLTSTTVSSSQAMTKVLSRFLTHQPVFDEGHLREDPESAKHEIESLLATMRSPNPEYASPKGSPFVEVFRTVWFRIVKVLPRIYLLVGGFMYADNHCTGG
ncbi:MAG: hypothetical protein M1830_006473 [Pleopsidium flavum]|nr:MAG: hypothetical protein M1830_006473 [Pleopsidium flavum]